MDFHCKVLSFSLIGPSATYTYTFFTTKFHPLTPASGGQMVVPLSEGKPPPFSPSREGQGEAQFLYVNLTID